jgi:DNA-binding CsgD family transcriptional regulator
VNGPTKDSRQTDGRARLTRREIECLHLLASGEQLKRVAHLLGLTPRTVEHYVAAARRKLGARTTTQAVAILVAQVAFGGTDVSLKPPAQ